MDEKQWKDFISSFKTDFDNLETNKNRAKRVLKNKLIEAVKKSSVEGCGVLFSGGIDSSLIAFILKKLNIGFTCYSVGLENAKDLEWAEKVANDLGFRLKKKILSLDEFEDILRKVVRILKQADVMKVGVGSVVYSGILLAKKDKTKVLFSGLGSEELFAGYQRHEEAMKNGFEALHKECFNGLKDMWSRDMTRDLSIAKLTGVELRLPFLDKSVIEYAMNINPMYKLDNNFKKIIIREVAEDLGIPKEFAWRKKKAAQYGSNFIKGMDKLAKRNGFEKKKDFLGSLL